MTIETIISNYVSFQRENYVFLMKLFCLFRDITYTAFMGQDWKICLETQYSEPGEKDSEE